MAVGNGKAATKAGTGATIGFEATLWATADTLRGNLDASEYKGVVLGLIFLKYISDAFEEKHAALSKRIDEGADPEDRDEYLSENIFWVPVEARWSRTRVQTGTGNESRVKVAVSWANTAHSRSRASVNQCTRACKRRLKRDSDRGPLK